MVGNITGHDPRNYKCIEFKQNLWLLFFLFNLSYMYPWALCGISRYARIYCTNYKKVTHMEGGEVGADANTVTGKHGGM